MDYDARHFHLLRMAIARGLRASQTGPGVYAVPSATVRGRVYKVPAGGPCQCASFGPCTHEALALDRYMLEEAPSLEHFDYETAKREDMKELRLRILRDETTELDREYLDYCREVYAAKHDGETIAA